MTTDEIRRRYLEFYRARGHAVIPSAPLVPENDPTVLFTTAGMHPLVPYLLGEPHPQGARLASAQKCLRTGDIDEVGDNRHLTFFEMLGNWSLGDYFKEEAIRWSFQFLTSKDEGLGLDPAKLYVTVWPGGGGTGPDHDAAELWGEVFASVNITAGFDVAIASGGRIFSDPSNWWGPAGLTGPCGPDTEMYYDVGGGASLTDGSGMPDFESGRLVEIWNDVFMTFDKGGEGLMEPLAQRNVDTGMGLERIAAVVQGVDTVYSTDALAHLLRAVTAATGAEGAAARIAADHLRAAAFLIADGVLPGNKDRGYVLRRLVRRAVLHAGGSGTGWLAAVLEAVVGLYGGAYPGLAASRAEILEALTAETAKFQRTLERGKAEIEKKERLTGRDAFDLYQSYGFPLELTREYAASRGTVLDEAGFREEFERHKELSRTASAGQFSSGLADDSEATTRYHTATHLLQQALRDVLGPHVRQRGSNLTAERLRFDFAHPEKMTDEQLAAVEAKVNGWITADLPVGRGEMRPEDALALGYIGLFGHKYGETVSTYDIGGVSREICTGPHAARTGSLGAFRITKEEAVSAGVRRIKGALQAED